MFITKPFTMIYKYRDILMRTSWSDIRAKYAGSVLGLFWLILYPLLLLAAYSFVYIFIFQSRFATFSTVEYVMLIFSGLIPFLGFTEGIAVSIPSISANSALVKNTMFPIDILTVKSIIYSQCTQVVGMIILIIALAISGKLTFWAILVVPIWLCQLMLGIGLGWILASLNIYFKDLQNIVTLITIFLMMVSPIAYTIDMIPEFLVPFLKLNPLYYFIMAYQDSMVIGCYPRGNVLNYIVIISISIFILGYWFFEKMKSVFADNI